jgi:hypothetical protein
MSQAVIDAAMRACATLDSVIESLFEDDGHAGAGTMPEIRADLCEAYNSLTDALSAELGLDTRQLLRDVAAADIETWRAILRAKGIM